MEYAYLSRNGELLLASEAAVPLSCIEYQYGFGVYESLRIVAGVPYFLSEHVARLMRSAQIIGLEHTLTPEQVAQYVRALVAKNEVAACNIKILLIGATKPEDATLYIQCLNPLYPDKKLYRDGAHTVSLEYERAFPQAKTLNMLRSYLAYRKARGAGAYDALLTDREGNVTEGTRTNFFTLKGKTLYSPPEAKILPGVTRKAVLRVAAKQGYAIEERDIALAGIGEYDGAFLTSTSAKIMPIKSVDEQVLAPMPDALRALMSEYDDFLGSCGGEMPA